MFDVEHIAKLARLGINEEEKAKFSKELAAILEFVEKLKEVDVEGMAPMSQATGLENVMRPDEEQKRNEEERQELLENAPERQGNYIKVKAVFE